MLVIWFYPDRDETQIRDVYIVFSINQPHCMVQNFVERQLGSRHYSVNLVDCILITSSVIHSDDRRSRLSVDEDDRDTDQCTDAPILHADAPEAADFEDGQCENGHGTQHEARQTQNGPAQRTPLPGLTHGNYRGGRRML